MTEHSEILTVDEVRALTGRTHRAEQVKWLGEHMWRYQLNAAGFPVVGRWYARMKLAGVDLAAMSPGKLPDFGGVR